MRCVALTAAPLRSAARRGRPRARAARLQLGGALPRARRGVSRRAGHEGPDERSSLPPTRSRRSAAAAAGAPTSWPAALRAPRPRGADRPAHARHRRPACVKPATTASPCTSSAFAAPDVPYVRNYFKSERLTRIARRLLVRAARARERFDIVHAQHVMTAAPAIRRRQGSRTAGRRHGARLLARLLLVGPDAHARKGLSSAPSARPAT